MLHIFSLFSHYSSFLHATLSNRIFTVLLWSQNLYFIPVNSHYLTISKENLICNKFIKQINDNVPRGPGGKNFLEHLLKFRLRRYTHLDLEGIKLTQ